MTLDPTKLVDLVAVMEDYRSKVRPEPEIRNKLDLNYEIKGQSIILNEISPVWNNPKELIAFGYAKTTFVKSKNVWKVFWKRADSKWHPYDPKPTVKTLQDFLKLVDEDKYGCFTG